ncbi:ABC transporter ATP-binding protein [Scrofimicrobium canadense]|nr:ABC transporter ATP-binding protein [Scrofimicrobium canadense]
MTYQTGIPTRTTDAMKQVPYVASAREISKIYGSGDTAVEALRSVTLEVAAGEFVAVMGPSGSGKSTLMNCMAGLDAISSGEVTIANQNLDFTNDRQLTELRREQVGFVFQSSNLVPTLNITENIELPFLLAGRRPSAEERAWGHQLQRMLGLEQRAHHRPAELSGGQRQRVAIARALVTRPAVVFADEPTGSLDSGSSREVLELLRQMTDTLAQSIVMVTHNPSAASYADRIIVIVDGRVTHQLSGAGAEEISGLMLTLEESR